VSQNIEQQFKAAVKALRLEAPHKLITVRDVHETYEGPDLPSDNEEDVDSDGDIVEDEEGNEDGDEVEPGRFEVPHCRCCHRPMEKRPTKLKTICVDCGRDVCQGRYEAQKPALMMLGSGELEAYSVDS